MHLQQAASRFLPEGQAGIITKLALLASFSVFSGQVLFFGYSETIVVLENALDTPRMGEPELLRAILSIPAKARLSLAETRAAIREGRM